MKQRIFNSLFLIAVILTAYFLGYKSGEKREITFIERDTVYQTRTISVADTVTNWLPKYIQVYVYDTVKADSILTNIERLDTTLVKNSDTLNLNIERYSYPYVHYSLAFNYRRTDSVKTIYEKYYLDKKETVFSKFHFGVGVGVGLNKIGSEYKIYPNVNLSIYYKLF